MSGESLVEKLGIDRRKIYLHLLSDKDFQDHPMSWHFWKFYVWPKYKEMLEALIFYMNYNIDSRNCGLITAKIKKSIEKATGKTWEEVKGILNE